MSFSPLWGAGGAYLNDIDWLLSGLLERSPFGLGFRQSRALQRPSLCPRDGFSLALFGPALPVYFLNLHKER